MNTTTPKSVSISATGGVIHATARVVVSPQEMEKVRKFLLPEGYIDLTNGQETLEEEPNALAQQITVLLSAFTLALPEEGYVASAKVLADRPAENLHLIEVVMSYDFEALKP